MTSREHIEQLLGLLAKRFPQATVDVDEPASASGNWLIDVAVDDQAFVVEFRPKLGFGLSSTSTDAYGEGADEFLQDEFATIERIAALVGSRLRTTPQRVHLLQELREQRNISQVALAEKLGVRQPTVSKIERRDDVALSTLRRYIEALGGVLRVTAQFSDGRFEIQLDDEAAS